MLDTKEELRLLVALRGAGPGSTQVALLSLLSREPAEPSAIVYG